MEFVRSRFFPWILLLILSLLPLSDFLRPGLPITHDGIDHVARIANFYQNLSEGNLIPRWAGNLNWGYGHPVLMFLYPLPSYFASFFHFLGFSFIDSVKLVFAVSFILSGFTMYLWVREFLGKEAGVASSVLYLFAPYRFVDLYVRGAIGEHVAFIFPPLVLYFLLKLSKTKLNFFDKKFFLLITGGSLSLAGFILSHNAISLLFAPFILFYAFFLLWQNKNFKRLFFSFLSLLVLGALISAFFWFPAFFEGKYTLRDIVTAGEYAKRFVEFRSLLYSPWSFGGTGQFSVQIGIVHILTVLSVPFVYLKLKSNKKILPLFLFTIFYLLFSIYLMLPQSNFLYNILTTLQKLQFPWRFLSVTVFTTALFGGFLIYAVPNKKRLATLSLLIVSSLFLTASFWKANGFLQKDDSFFQKVYKGTTDTGESSPVWSVRFMEKEPKDQIEIIEGEGSIKKVSGTNTSHAYEIDVQTKNARVKENTLYFPGWKIFADGKSLDLEFQDPRHRGLMTFYLPKGNHKVYAEFSETKLRQFSNYLTFASILALFTWASLIFLGTRRFL
ncbi:MAG: 6-pyruvoyl-tetrahydropterin synthase-related protein [Patescibacteria group bacterium]